MEDDTIVISSVSPMSLFKRVREHEDVYIRSIRRLNETVRANQIEEALSAGIYLLDDTEAEGEEAAYDIEYARSPEFLRGQEERRKAKEAARDAAREEMRKRREAQRAMHEKAAMDRYQSESVAANATKPKP